VKTLADSVVQFEKISEEREAESREWEAQSRARDAALDARIGKLVTAIAALANRRADEPPAQSTAQP
jgi:hypothetical protein